MNQTTAPPKKRGTPATLGEVITRARQERGLSIRQLAPHINVTFSQLSRIESGHTQRPAPEVIHHLATVLDLDERTLFALVGINPPLPGPVEYFRAMLHASADEAAGMLALLEQHYPHVFTSPHQDAEKPRTLR